jgi:hypothetical protein
VDFNYRMHEERERCKRQEEINYRMLTENLAEANRQMVENFEQVNQWAEAQGEINRQETERMIQQYQPTWTPDPPSYNNNW